MVRNWERVASGGILGEGNQNLLGDYAPIDMVTADHEANRSARTLARSRDSQNSSLRSFAAQDDKTGTLSLKPFKHCGDCGVLSLRGRGVTVPSESVVMAELRDIAKAH